MTDYDIEPGQTWVFDRMRPEDAEGVCSLFLSVYGKDYPIRTFIDPEMLIQENKAERTVSSVARTPNGDIVGHNAIYHSAPSKRIFESGAGLVHKNYRGGNGIFTGLGVHGIETAKEFGAWCVWGEPVTNHVFAQKSVESYNMLTYALEVDLMPAAAYAKEKSAPGRVSTLMSFNIIDPRPHQVFLPAVYEKQLNYIYTPLAENRDFDISDGKPPQENKTEIHSQYFDFAKVNRIAVNQLGADFMSSLADCVTKTANQGAAVFQVWLPLSDPAVGWAVEKLRSQGWFTGGVLPLWFDNDGLLMQKTKESPYWENINLYYDRAKNILELVRRDWREVTGATS